MYIVCYIYQGYYPLHGYYHFPTANCLWYETFTVREGRGIISRGIPARVNVPLSYSCVDDYLTLIPYALHALLPSSLSLLFI